MTGAFQSRNGHNWTEEQRLRVMEDIGDADHHLLALRRTYAHMIERHGDTPEGAYLATVAVIELQQWNPLLLTRMLMRLMMVAYEGKSDGTVE